MASLRNLSPEKSLERPIRSLDSIASGLGGAVRRCYETGQPTGPAALR
jgi:hypothetical protein